MKKECKPMPKCGSPALPRGKKVSNVRSNKKLTGTPKAKGSK